MIEPLSHRVIESLHRSIIIEANNWCWCADCDAPSEMAKHGRCVRCGSNAVAFLKRIQVGREAISTQHSAIDNTVLLNAEC